METKEAKQTKEDLFARIIEARNYRDDRKAALYEQIANGVDLDVLFSLAVGFRQSIVDLIAQDGTTMFAFRLSERATKLLKTGDPTMLPAPLQRDKDGKTIGIWLENGNARGKVETLFEVGKTVRVPAMSAIYLWARYGSSEAEGRPVARLPSCFGFLEYIGRDV